MNKLSSLAVLGVLVAALFGLQAVGQSEPVACGPADCAPCYQLKDGEGCIVPPDFYEDILHFSCNQECFGSVVSTSQTGDFVTCTYHRAENLNVCWNGACLVEGSAQAQQYCDLFGPTVIETCYIGCIVNPCSGKMMGQFCEGTCSAPPADGPPDGPSAAPEDVGGGSAPDAASTDLPFAAGDPQAPPEDTPVPQSPPEDTSVPRSPPEDSFTPQASPEASVIEPVAEPMRFVHLDPTGAASPVDTPNPAPGCPTPPPSPPEVFVCIAPNWNLILPAETVNGVPFLNISISIGTLVVVPGLTTVGECEEVNSKPTQTNSDLSLLFSLETKANCGDGSLLANELQPWAIALIVVAAILVLAGAVLVAWWRNPKIRQLLQPYRYRPHHHLTIPDSPPATPHPQ